VRGPSLQAVFAMSGPRSVFSFSIFLAQIIISLCSFAFSSATLGRMTDVTLAELVKESEAIVYGRVDSDTASREQSAANVVRFKILSVLKGQRLVGTDKTVSLCNAHSDSEQPDLSKLKGTAIVFVTRASNCFDLSHGYVSVVQVTDSRASTYAIQGQPDSQLSQSFLKMVRAIVADQSH
jgi:hypothetical protein